MNQFANSALLSIQAQKVMLSIAILNKQTNKHCVWHINAVEREYGEQICSNNLFLQRILGCDTTSPFYGIGKGASL